MRSARACGKIGQSSQRSVIMWRGSFRGTVRSLELEQRQTGRHYCMLQCVSVCLCVCERWKRGLFKCKSVPSRISCLGQATSLCGWDGTDVVGIIQTKFFACDVSKTRSGREILRPFPRKELKTFDARGAFAH